LPGTDVRSWSWSCLSGRINGCTSVGTLLLPPRWLLLEPITKPNRINTVFIDEDVKPITELTLGLEKQRRR
jgi:hypothetical protein